MPTEELSYLNFTDFYNNISTISNPIIGILQKNKACVIRDFPSDPDDKTLVDLAGIIGTPVHEDRNINGEIVYRVEINNNLARPTYANTAYEFLCHTDCSEFAYPPDTVIILCEKQSENGGESYLVWLEDFISNFSFTELNLLSEPIYPLGTGYFPILETENQQLVIRYNRAAIDLHIQAFNLVLEPEIIALLNKLDELLGVLLKEVNKEMDLNVNPLHPIINDIDRLDRIKLAPGGLD